MDKISGFSVDGGRNSLTKRLKDVEQGTYLISASNRVLVVLELHDDLCDDE